MPRADLPATNYFSRKAQLQNCLRTAESGSEDDRLSKIISQVIQGSTTRDQWTEACREIYKLCESEESITHACGIVHASLRNHMTSSVCYLFSITDNVELLTSYCQEWTSWQAIVLTLNNLLHQVYAFSGDETSSAWNRMTRTENFMKLAFMLWEDSVLLPLRGKVIELLLRVVDDDRKGKSCICDEEISRIIAILTANDSSGNDFYEPFKRAYFDQLEQCFWSKLAESPSALMSVNQAKEYVATEGLRALKFLRSEDCSKTFEMVHKTLLGNNPSNLCSTARKTFLNFEVDKLKEIFDLMQPMSNFGINCFFKTVRAAIPQHAEKVFERTFVTAEPEVSFVETCLVIANDLRTITERVFGNELAFDATCDNVLSTAVNVIKKYIKATPSQLLAAYYHKLLANATGAYADYESNIKKTMIVINYVEDEIDFQERYLNFLKLRLERCRWTNIQCEQFALKELRKSKGHDFVFRMEKIVDDIADSLAVNMKFQRFLVEADAYPGHEKVDRNISFSVAVLNGSTWLYDHSTSPRAKVPESIEVNMSIYACLYRGLYETSRRSFTWRNNLALTDVQVNFPPNAQPYLLKCSAFTAIVLLLFENEERLTIDHLEAQSALANNDLREVLDELTKVKILLGSNGVVSTCSCDVFTLNYDFRCPSGELHLRDAARTEESPVPDEPSRKRLAKRDKVAYTEALLVRILKKYRMLSHEDYVSRAALEAPDQFEADPEIFEQCLRSLINKDYVEVVDSMYHYMY